MIKKITLFAFFLSIAFVLVDTTAYTYSDKPPAVRTGAPNEPTCAVSGCHDSSPVNSGGGEVLLSVIGGATKYKPDSTYTFQVKVNDAGMVRFGFELTALDSAHKSVGTFSLTNGTTTQTFSGNINGTTRRYVSHKDADQTSTWTFKWKAPAMNPGVITFYAVGNAANGNGGDSGDQIYTGSFEFPQDPSTISSIAEKGLNIEVYPNPFTESFKVNLPGIFAIALYDVSGKLVLEQADLDATKSVQLPEGGNGLYYLLVTTQNGEQGLRKLFSLKK